MLSREKVEKSDRKNYMPFLAPMIELPDPRAGLDVGGVIQPLTVSVFSAWTDQEMQPKP